jgi:glutathione S-transferase
MKLYYAPDSIALASHIALAESGLDYGLVRVDHHAHLNEDGSSYLAVNPNGYVPALELGDGEILTETLSILQYIADLAPDSGLCPPIGSSARYRVLAWASFVATELHQKFMRFTQPNLTAAQRLAIIDLLKQRTAHAEAQLSRSQFLAGDRLTIADIFLFVATGWFKYHEVPTALWPHLDRYRSIIGERPAVRRALREEGLE